MTSKIQDSRAAYWDDSYANYWKERVGEAKDGGQSSIQKGDAKTEGDWVYEEIFKQHPLKSGVVLDVGCAWGRMFPLYFSRGNEVVGIDISSAMIDSARENFSEDNRVKSLKVAVAEETGLADCSVDNIVCVAVFDATYQNKALGEFLRILKPGGMLYLTGKSDRYLSNDKLGFDAEIGARGKGHPNSFTDVPLMISTLEEIGCEIFDSYFFAYRGDFAEFKYHKSLDDRFYEWLLVIKAPDSSDGCKIPNISDSYSKTFHEISKNT